MEEIQTEQRNSFAAPVIFILVFVFHFVSKEIADFAFQSLEKGSGNNLDVQLRGEIKKLLKEASTLSQPSTFAQAAKLRRMAAAKEKELTKYLETQQKDVKLSFGTYGKHLMISKAITYFVLILWFWKIPVATISDQLVQPFGRLLSWRAGSSLKDSVVVGVIPWLVVSTRVSKFICRKVFE
ncbi:tail-anchored protein insertion receptor WRB-like protein [Perilla frutescens var. hirtella]|uniref:Tail-anchored protein insertion receptor WRB-like protein n=1 Tax=Perilla frutescens var. hirtella TaxID=608512 RepID=A0AAD4JFH1_PERFH|nr:tail-anchored protein insertion receptor WRB-like protein [Perilla frutescens var. hirtella]